MSNMSGTCSAIRFERFTLFTKRWPKNLLIFRLSWIEAFHDPSLEASKMRLSIRIVNAAESLFAARPPFRHRARNRSHINTNNQDRKILRHGGIVCHRNRKGNPVEIPSFLSPYLEGDTPKFLTQGILLGAIGTMIIGFYWGGWHTGSTVKSMVSSAAQTAKIEALAPICADKFRQASIADNSLIVKIKAVDSWARDSHVKDAGWATFPGGEEPDSKVAEACAELVSKTLK